MALVWRFEACLEGLDMGNEYHGSTHQVKEEFFGGREDLSYLHAFICWLL